MFGQCKKATTLLTEDGCHLPVIARDSFRQRREAQSAPFRRGWGARPMHETTFTLSKPSGNPDYTTINKQYYGGSKSLNPVDSPTLHYYSQTSPYYLTHGSKDLSWDTNYSQEYRSKTIKHADVLQENSLNHSRGMLASVEVEAALKPSDKATSYWSQYNRIHSKLGYLLGPGVPKDYPIRKQYNFITGEMGAPAWQACNNKISGNRVLHAARQLQKDVPITY